MIAGEDHHVLVGTARRGPLQTLRVVEIGGIGPGPFAAMILADLGADVIRIERPAADEGELAAGDWNLLHRNRRSVAIDLKHPDSCELVLALCERADALIEGFRPGVMERLGLGPESVLDRAPQLVYGRMTGYGQDGPMASAAGHDINYISIAGVLSNFARQGEAPLAPLNLVGDFAGGALFLVVGILSAILEARMSGRGQVVDAAMVDGSAMLLGLFHGMLAAGMWSSVPGTNFLDSGAHFYEVYETADERHMAVGAIEPQFYAELLRVLEIEPDEAPQWDRERWPELKRRFAERFAERTMLDWENSFAGVDACVTPVLGISEAVTHPHLAARGTFTDVDGVTHPSPAPRFSRTPATPPSRPPHPGADTDTALAAWGIPAVERNRLRERGALLA